MICKCTTEDMLHVLFMLLIPCIFLHSVFLKTITLHTLTLSKADHKTHFICGVTKNTSLM